MPSTENRDFLELRRKESLLLENFVTWSNAQTNRQDGQGRTGRVDDQVVRRRSHPKPCAGSVGCDPTARFSFLVFAVVALPLPPTLLVPVLNAGGPRIHGQSSLLRDMGLSICPHGCRFVPVVMCCRANHCASPRLRGSERLEPRKAVRTWSAVTADSHGSRCDKLADWSGARPPDCEDRLRVPGYRSSDIGTTRHGWDG